MSYSNRSKTLSTWLISLLIISVGLNGYLWFKNSQQNTEITTQKNEFFELEKINTELEQDYQAALDNLEELRGDNQEMNEMIDKQKADLRNQKQKISDLIWAKRELGKAKEEMAQLKVESTRAFAELSDLKKKYDVVSKKAAKLESENQGLVMQVNQQKSANDELAAAKASLVSEKANLSKSNEKLSSKVDMAEAIKINFIQVQGYQLKKNGDIKKQSKAKKIQMLRTCFKTETNMVTQAGEKEFFIRIVDPSGKTLALEESGSGVLTNKLNNTQVRFTTAGTIQYDNADAEGCIDWTPNFKLAKGEYNVEMYNNSYIVGQGTFKLK